MRAERHEAWKVLLKGIVDIIIFVGSDFKVLFELWNFVLA